MNPEKSEYKEQRFAAFTNHLSHIFGIEDEVNMLLHSKFVPSSHFTVFLGGGGSLSCRTPARTTSRQS